MATKDDIIEAVKAAAKHDEVTFEEYDNVCNTASRYLIDHAPGWPPDKYDTEMDRIHTVEDAFLAAAHEGKGVDVSKCILVIRGHKDPDEAELPKPKVEAYNEAIQRHDDDVNEIIDEIMKTVDELNKYANESKDLSDSST